MNDKIQLKIIYKSEDTTISVNKSFELERLVKFINALFEDLEFIEYEILLNNSDIRKKYPRKKLSEIFINESINYEDLKTAVPLQISILTEEDQNILNFECVYINAVRSFQIDKHLNFQKFKYYTLSLYPEIEQENYCILYNNVDIANIYANDTELRKIFDLKAMQNEGKIRISIITHPKNFVEYHKKCSFCYAVKAIQICNRCAIANCQGCSPKDPHMINNVLNFVKLLDFKKYEENTLDDFLKRLKEYFNENTTLNSDNFSQMVNEKINNLEKKFSDLIDLINNMKNIQINGLKAILDLLMKFKPESISGFINTLYELILLYKKNPYFDCEESMKKILEFEKLLSQFSKEFGEYKFNLSDFLNKFFMCMKIDIGIFDILKQETHNSKLIFKKSNFIILNIRFQRKKIQFTFKGI